jgi:hypothetical protein
MPCVRPALSGVPRRAIAAHWAKHGDSISSLSKRVLLNTCKDDHPMAQHYTSQSPNKLSAVMAREDIHALSNTAK